MKNIQNYLFYFFLILFNVLNLVHLQNIVTDGNYAFVPINVAFLTVSFLMIKRVKWSVLYFVLAYIGAHYFDYFFGFNQFGYFANRLIPALLVIITYCVSTEKSERIELKTLFNLK